MESNPPTTSPAVSPVDASRRSMLALGQCAALSVLPPVMLSLPSLARAASGMQSDWRYCNKCHQLFFDGYPQKGRCTAGGGHQAQGYSFRIDHDDAKRLAGGTRQYDWRFCTKCFTMFFDGYPDKAKCPAGGGHAAQGFMFGLLHSGAGTGQDAWRFCTKCHALFFDGYPDKGRCQGGGGHAAAGFNFRLPYGESVASVGTAQRIVQDTITAQFNQSRARIADVIKGELTRADRVSKGWTLYDMNLQIGDGQFAFTSDSAFNFKILRTHIYFKSTQPSGAGSYADPALEVNFTTQLQGILIPSRRAGEKPKVEAMVLEIPWLEIKGRNATGASALAVIHFWQATSAEGRRIVQQAYDKVLRIDLTGRVNAALQRI